MSAHGGRTVGSLETWQPEDKSFTKHVLEEGHGDMKPNEDSVCIVHITTVGDLEISDDILGCYRLNVDTEITVGEADTRLSELLDKVVMSMKEGERCYINCHVTVTGEKVTELDLGHRKTPKFNVTLKSFSRAADLAELEPDELLERAEHHKSQGVELYSAGNLEFAVVRFRRALDCVKHVTNGTVSSSSALPKSVTDRATVVHAQCELNLAACRLKTKEYALVIEHCSAALALDPLNVKGLFRRSQALTKLGRYDEARKDATDARHLEPTNKAVMSQLRDVDELIQKEKRIYQKMFTRV
jgi:FK506-binding protein 4/5